MSKIRLFSLLIFALISHQSNAFQVSGNISDQSGSVAYCAVYAKGTTYGVVSNIKGEYFLELAKGTHTIVFESIGYAKAERIVEVKSNIRLNVKLTETEEKLNVVVVDKNREDPAYAIIRQAIKRRQEIEKKLTSYKADMYIKASLEVEDLEHPDTTTVDLNTKKRVNLIESYGQLYFNAPNHYKEEKRAYRDLAEKSTQNVSVSFDVDNDGVESIEITNPYLFFTNVNDGVFDFNKSRLFLSVLSEVPYVSPIANNALNNYAYKLKESFAEKGKLIYKIKVKPTSQLNAFEGVVYINEDFTLNSVDLSLNRYSLRFFDNFSIIQNYMLDSSGIPVVTRQEFVYSAGMEAGKTAYGHTIVRFDRYTINPPLKAKFMRNGKVVYDTDSYDMGEDFWVEIRPVTLKPIEQKYIYTQDSIQSYHKSAEYLSTQDSLFNHLGVWDFLINGIQHKNRASGWTWYAYPLIAQIKINTVDGYRHALGGVVTKEWENGKELETSGNINYGLLNENIRGEVNLKYKFDPFKFGRVRLRYAKMYSMINTHESIRATFSPSNYAENTGFGIGHEREWFNGFLAKIYLDYNQYTPYRGKTLENFWDNYPIFSQPQDFDPFEELVLKVSTKISFAQEFEMRPNKKMIMGTKYPIVHVHYTKGIKPWLKSDVNFDFIEFTASQDIRIARSGLSRFTFLAGRYINDREVRLSNLKYFRGSDRYYFSNALRTFQLVGDLSLRTSKAYVQGNYIHHFNGTLLGRMRAFNRMSIELAGGGGALYLEETNLKHLELFAGLERPFKLWRQLFRFGAYYVTSTSSEHGINQGFKFGIDFYNGYAHKWQY